MNFMKTPPSVAPATKGSRSGMTLIELSVVLVVLLSLISIIFIGARAWKRGSDRSANIMNLRNTQQAMRGHENLRANQRDSSFDISTLQEYMKMPSPPNAEIEYVPWEEITPIGVLWLGPNEAGEVGAEFGPSPGMTEDW
jgi:prepilin-type N-terminal cleavage/methylation domain-containing protein